METPIPFLSTDWFDLIESLYALHHDAIPEKFIGNSINFVVTGVPEQDTCAFSIADGRYNRASQAEPNATVTVDYQTAHTILVEQNVSAGMMALMTGKLKVDGNLATVLLLKEAQDVPEFKEMSQIVLERTQLV